MSEIRQDQATKRWVIMATERAKRPRDLIAPATMETPAPEYLDTCPFCPGNEHMTPPPLYVLEGETGGNANWRVRVVPNKFAALSPGDEVIVQDPDWFTKVNGIGAHEVIIESPKHHANPATMTISQVTDALVAAGYRFRALQQDRRLSYTAFFRNHKLAAGSSLTHPHTQLIATPVAPTNVRLEIEEARRHFDDRMHCVYCELIEREREAGHRVVFETDDYFVFQPFASRWPFETWILPKRHAPMLGAHQPSDLRPLAMALRGILGALYHGLGDPAYNLVLHEAPLRDSCEDYWHWHIEILPRLSTAAGFELGTGIWINTMLPEAAAEHLRGFVSLEETA